MSLVYVTLYVTFSDCPSVHLSICLSIHPACRNHTSCDHDNWYTCVKWWYLQVFFSVYQNPGFKRAKNGPKWQKMSGLLQVSETIHHMIVIYCTHVKWYYLQAFFCCCCCIFSFSKFSFSGFLVGLKSKKWFKMTKSSVLGTPYLRNHAWYDCHLWYTCVKR